MIFDTDVVIWTFRGNDYAAQVIEEDNARAVSVISCMELHQGARNKQEKKVIRAFLQAFEIIPLSENIGHRGSIYLEEYALKSNMGVADALIAASAVENQLPLCTGNVKDYRLISELQINAFQPE